MTKIKLVQQKLCLAMIAVFILSLFPPDTAKADTASAVTIGTINYESYTIQVYNNNNSIVYYSIDNTAWTEVEGAYNTTTKSYSMDISWVSGSSDTTLYFKGDTVQTVITVVLPAQNNTFSVDYNKADGTFTFNNAEEADTFEWRKNTDYSWKTVDMDENANSYKTFLRTIEKFKVTGATILMRIPQVIGTGADDVGLRASKSVTVTITPWGVAPSVKVNSSKLNLNTTASMEYYDYASDLWIECTTSMGLDEIVPQVLYDNGSTSATIKIRKAATTSAPCSKTTILTIPGQKAAPTIGDNSADVTYYSMNSKLMLQFNKASSTNVYEYVIIRPDRDFEPSTTSWKTVKSTSLLTISSSTAPEGSTVYVRKAGTDANTSTGTSLVLASATGSFTVDY